MKRYFIAFYCGTTDLGNFKGHTDVITNDGSYMNKYVFINSIKSESKRNITSVIISNIIELSESDYIDWSKGV